MRLFALLLLLPALCAADTVTIHRDGSSFCVQGWRAAVPLRDGWPRLFRVSVQSPIGAPLLGDYAVNAGVLCFNARYPIAPSLNVHAYFAPPGVEPVTAIFPGGIAIHSPSTRVTKIYPAVDQVPANLLKFYLYFSAPMQRGQAWHHLRLLNGKGNAVDLPFLKIDQELWDPEHRRLTILFDPGRIKRGVLPREADGTALSQGETYTLIVDASWPDAAGQLLIATHRHRFTVTAEDRTPINPAKWQLTLPTPATRQPLKIQFGEALEQALAQRLIVFPMPGELRLHPSATGLSFTPAEPWAVARFEIGIDTTLEDLAGNKVLRAFDVDDFDAITQHPRSNLYRLPVILRR